MCGYWASRSRKIQHVMNECWDKVGLRQLASMIQGFRAARHQTFYMAWAARGMGMSAPPRREGWAPARRGAIAGSRLRRAALIRRQRPVNKAMPLCGNSLASMAALGIRASYKEQPRSLSMIVLVTTNQLRLSNLGRSIILDNNNNHVDHKVGTSAGCLPAGT